MKSVIAASVESSPAGAPPDAVVISWRARVAAGWLRGLFWCARHAPWIVIRLRRPTMYVTARYARSIRHATACNLHRIRGQMLPSADCIAFAESVVGRFCDFVLEVAQSVDKTPEQLRQQIDSIEGREEYLARRKLGGGAILVTAHMGSFEVGMAALTQVEPQIHVVFKRDSFDGFESIRRQLRRNLGIHEAAIDDGWQTWMKLRDALRADQVIVLQADRAMPGQKSEIVPFLGGHIRLPLGPLKLALASGSPVIPVFTVMTGPRRCRVYIEPAIEVAPHDEQAADALSPALQSLAKSMEKFVSRYPDQWLVLHPAFVEDETVGGNAP